MNIQELLSLVESKTLNSKHLCPPPKNDSIAKTAIAFSNTSGGKMIIFSLYKIKLPQ